MACLSGGSDHEKLVKVEGNVLEAEGEEESRRLLDVWQSFSVIQGDLEGTGQDGGWPWGLMFTSPMTLNFFGKDVHRNTDKQPDVHLPPRRRQEKGKIKKKGGVGWAEG